MSCGRLSRVSDAWRARFDAAHKGGNAIFVQPLSTNDVFSHTILKRQIQGRRFPPLELPEYFDHFISMHTRKWLCFRIRIVS
jgi:hypothetical protein